jgi:hypothetical protein
MTAAMTAGVAAALAVTVTRRWRAMGRWGDVCQALTEDEQGADAGAAAAVPAAAAPPASGAVLVGRLRERVRIAASVPAAAAAAAASVAA